MTFDRRLLTEAADASSIEFTAALLRGDGGVTHVVAVLRDVTERREQDLQLRRRLAELGG
ncbi:MAG TPA: hypothetical protein VFH50_07650 [Acidimicrobiales bacterium]|nr:hypothetical protein [Acidimicrobiales bacterium]